MARQVDVFADRIVAELPGLRRFAMSLCRNEAAAEDLMQDAVVKALANRDKFDAGTNMRAWLNTILRNTYFSLYRKRGREVEDPEGAAALALAAPENQFDVVHFKEVQHRIRLLPAGMRKALRLIAFEGLSYDEAADCLQVEVGTIKSRVNRARAFLAGEDLPTDGDVAPALPVEEIRRLHGAGASVRDIAASLGLPKADVFMVIAA